MKHITPPYLTKGEENMLDLIIHRVRKLNEFVYSYCGNSIEDQQREYFDDVSGTAV